MSKQHLLDARALGFLLEDSDGDYVSRDLSEKVVLKSKLKVGPVRVWFVNKNKKQYEKMVKLIETEHPRPEGLDYFHKNQALKGLRYFIENERDLTCQWMSKEAYLKFYETAGEHIVDMVAPWFYDKFPKAIRK